MKNRFWGTIACAIGQTAVYASLAEMASISPTAGGQYHWVSTSMSASRCRGAERLIDHAQVSEFSPAKYQKLLSYISGWLTAIGWQVSAM